MILICDQSLDRFGYCLVETNDSTNSFNLVQYGFVQLDKRLDYYERILSLNKLFSYFCTNWDIDTIVTEQVFLNVNPTTFMKLVSLLFFIRHYCSTHSIQFETPLNVSTYRQKWAKSYLGLKEADKWSLFEWMKHYLNHQTDNFVHDTSDAVLMAWFYCIKMLGLTKGNLLEGMLVNMDIRKLPEAVQRKSPF